MGVLRGFQGCFEEVSMEFHVSFKGISWIFQREF